MFVAAVVVAVVVSAFRPDGRSQVAATTAGQRDEPAVTAAAEEPASVAEDFVSRPYLLDVDTGKRTRMADSLVGPTTDAYVPSPDGASFVFRTCKETPCQIELTIELTDGLTVANIDGTDAHALVSPEGGIIYAAWWSPDGSKLVYQEAVGDGENSGPIGNLFVHDLAGGRRTQVTDLKLSDVDWYFLWAQFSPDGRNVIYHLPRNGSMVTKFDVWSVPVTGGKPKRLLRDASFPVPLPDGERIAFVPGASDFSGGSIAIADSKGRQRTLVEAKKGVWWPTVSPDGSRIAFVDGAQAWAFPSSLYVVEISTGETTLVARAHAAAWLDNDTLIVTPRRTR